jgi:hypothetical protein
MGEIVVVGKKGSWWRCPDQCAVTSSFALAGSRRFQAQYPYRLAAPIPFHLLKQTLGILSPGSESIENRPKENFGELPRASPPNLSGTHIEQGTSRTEVSAALPRRLAQQKHP